MNLHKKTNHMNERQLYLFAKFAELLVDRERYAQVCREAARRGMSVFDYFTDLAEQEAGT